MSGRPFFYRQTQEIRVTVRPLYLKEQSRPAKAHYVFAYFVRIENVGTDGAQLLSRRWRIHDSSSGDTETEGEGVAGSQPHLPPGGVHEYQSFCVLRSPSGFMEGEFRFVRADDSHFTAAIPRFVLEADASPEARP